MKIALRSTFSGSERIQVAERDRAILREASPALRRNGHGYVFHRAHGGGTLHVSGHDVKRLVEAGLLRWVNSCRSAAVLTEQGEKARDG
jgi:hypothetical protein